MQPLFLRPCRRPTASLSLAIVVLTLCFVAEANAEVIVSCGFEGATDTWHYGTPTDFRSKDSGDNDTPRNQRIFAGEAAWSVSGNKSSTLTFSKIFLAGYKDAFIRYHVSSTGIDSNGHSGSDYILTRVAETTDALDAANAIILLKGNSKAVWGYTNNTDQQKVTWGSNILTCQPAAEGGLRSTDGYSDFLIRIPDDKKTVALRVYIYSKQTKAYWNLDEFTLEGTATESRERVWTGGSGVWSTKTNTLAWTDSASNAACAWDNCNGDNARFSQSGSTVTIASETTIAARSLVFDADGCSINADGNSALLAMVAGGSGEIGPSTIQVTNVNDTATIQATLTGNRGVGLTKTGAGTLALRGPNIYTGATIVNAGTLRFLKGSTILSTLIDVHDDATLDISALGANTFADKVVVRGEGTILGTLHINDSGIHDIGYSPGVQRIYGNYVMDGELLVDVCGAMPGDGFDQVLVSDVDPCKAIHDVVLSGALRLNWTAADDAFANGRIWILSNETTGQLFGEFSNFHNGDVVYTDEQATWQIFYGADLETGTLLGGNDVLLQAVSVPEPSTVLLLAEYLAILCSFAMLLRSHGFCAAESVLPEARRS